MPSRMERRQERLRRRRREACAWIVEIAVVFVLAMLVRHVCFFPDHRPRAFYARNAAFRPDRGGG